MDNRLSGRRVLVVEDEMLVLMMTEDLLVDLGCEVAAAATVDEAMTLLNEQHFDAAMLDINLNGDTTGAIADALAAQHVPFLFATGCVAQRKSGDHTDRPVLNKPFQHSALVAALNSLLDQETTSTQPH